MFFYIFYLDLIHNVFLDITNSSLLDIISFLSSTCGPLVKHIKLASIIFILWMIRRMRNHARFQQHIPWTLALIILKYKLQC